MGTSVTGCEPVRRVRTDPDDLDPVLGLLCDDRAELGRADVESDQHIFHLNLGELLVTVLEALLDSVMVLRILLLHAVEGTSHVANISCHLG